MANRNTNSYFSHTPTISFPRTRFKQDTRKRIQSQRHGFLTPFFIDIVYPGDSWSDKANIFARMDKSARVPLDDIFTDIYYFYVPFRILDKNFEKILGAKDPYDSNVYGFPVTKFQTGDYYFRRLYYYDNDSSKITFNGSDFLPFYLDYKYAIPTREGTYDMSFMSYPLTAYYKIYNDYFRDENLDDSIPLDDFYNVTISARTGVDIMSVLPDNVKKTLKLLPVNKFHDYFTSCIISPSKGPTVTIPLGVSAPLAVGNTAYTVGNIAGGSYNKIMLSGPNNGGSLGVNMSDELVATSGTLETEGNVNQTNLYADLTNAAAASINSFALALKIEQLYQRRAIYGTRLTEVYRGQWGINVPDDILDRPEYLGGINTDMNMIPVLGTATDNLALMSGNSSTLFVDNGYYKAFFEFGLIIGLSVTRVKHVYAQSVSKRVWGLRNDLDLYNPIFANIGPQPVYKHEIYNDLLDIASGSDVFAYQEAWADLRTGFSGVAGIFDGTSGEAFTEFRTLWTYADYYTQKPTFSSAWLKEDPYNVARTLTGQLIPGANTRGGHQFIFAYYNHPVVTRELPARSELKLTTRY